MKRKVCKVCKGSGKANVNYHQAMHDAAGAFMSAPNCKACKGTGKPPR